MTVWSAATTTSFMLTFLRASHEPIDSLAQNKMGVEQTHSSADCFHGNALCCSSAALLLDFVKKKFWNEVRVSAVIKLISYNTFKNQSLYSLNKGKSKFSWSSFFNHKKRNKGIKEGKYLHTQAFPPLSCGGWSHAGSPPTRVWPLHLSGGKDPVFAPWRRKWSIIEDDRSIDQF